jgi:hypothetical protein
VPNKTGYSKDGKSGSAFQNTLLFWLRRSSCWMCWTRLMYAVKAGWG